MSLPSLFVTTSVETNPAAADIEYSAQNFLHAKIVQPYVIENQECIILGQNQTDAHYRDKQKKITSIFTLQQVHSRRLEVCYYC